MAIFVVVVLFGGMLVSMAMGEWTTKSTKEPIKFSEGEFAGQYDPADIRGSYTFGDVSRLFEIPLDQLAVAFRVSEADVAAVALKTIEEKFVNLEVDLGTNSVRLFVNLLIKDWATSQGLAFSTFKSQLQALVDAVK